MAKKKKEWTVDKICGWCKKKLGTSKSDLGPHATHGICMECAKKWFPEEYEKLMKEGRGPFAENPRADAVSRMQKRARDDARRFLKDFEKAARSGGAEPHVLADALNEFMDVIIWFREATRAMAQGARELAYDLYFKAAVLSGHLSRMVTGQYR